MNATRILVTGAGGTLGGAVVTALRARGLLVRGLGRGPAPITFDGEWTRVDLLSRQGLAAALVDIRAVVHCASNPEQPDEDIHMIEGLSDSLAKSRIHFVYIGIAGIEEAAAVSPYYRAKLQCERKIAAGGAPYTILRATQMHSFVAHMLRRLSIGPMLLTPPITLQPVDPAFVARSLAICSLGDPQEEGAVLHGPETLDMGVLAQDWLDASGSRKLRLPVPAIGPLAAFRRLRRVQGLAGGLGWKAWLSRCGDEFSRDD